MRSINKYFEDNKQTVNATLYLAKGLILPEILELFLGGDGDLARKTSVS